MDLVRKDTERTYKNVVKQIQSLIQAGTLTPGDQLFSERQMSEKLGVSRTTLREALTALEALGVIQMTQDFTLRLPRQQIIHYC